MFYIKIENGTPVNNALLESNLRSLFPGKGLSDPIVPAEVKDLGYEPFIHSEQPSLERYEKAVNPTPVLRGDGIWIQQWKVEEMTDEEKKQADDAQALRIRMGRNELLKHCDWTQLNDSEVQSNNDEWLAYRKALRDLPTTAGFPWDVTWPADPGSLLSKNLRDFDGTPA